jgi:hypothetical protein
VLSAGKQLNHVIIQGIASKGENNRSVQWSRSDEFKAEADGIFGDWSKTVDSCPNIEKCMVSNRIYTIFLISKPRGCGVSP